MKRLVERFFRDEQGLELSEYAVMAALIIITIIVAIVALRDQIAGAFNRVATTIETAEAN